VIVGGGSGYRLESESDGVTLVVVGPWSDEMARQMESGRVDGLDLNYAKGFKDTDLAFVRGWPIKRLSILARTVADLSAVRRLGATLESLSVQSAPSATVDVSAFPLLRSLAAEWVQVRSSVAEGTRLQDLMLRSYNEADLTALRWNTGLRRLRFKERPRLRSLAGVESLRSLEHLAVYLAPLNDLEALRDVASPLSELHVESCPVGDLEPLAGLRVLRLLNASECGDVRSLGPLRELRNLEVVWMFGTTKVLDNDLSALAGLPQLRELRMRSRQTYRPSVEEIQRDLVDSSDL